MSADRDPAKLGDHIAETLRLHDKRFDAMEQRMQTMDSYMAASREDRRADRAQLDLNTQTTADIKKDTALLIDVIITTRTLGRFGKWVSTIGAAAAAIIGVNHYWK